VIPVVAPRFDIVECNNELERTFIEAMHERSETDMWYPDAWMWDDRVVLLVCVADRTPGYGVVLRSLRIDFDGQMVCFGPDETHQLATDLNPAHPGVFALSGQSIAELADAAANWLQRELRRPIMRQEWDLLDASGVSPRLWVLAGSGEVLAARGQRLTEFGPPDRGILITQSP
jgi:hypothetical protein